MKYLLALIATLILVPALYAQNFSKKLPHGVPKTRGCGHVSGIIIDGNVTIYYHYLERTSENRRCNIIHYQLKTRLARQDADGDSVTTYSWEPEKLQWVPRHKTPRRFVREHALNLRNFLPGKCEHWRELSPSSQEYKKDDEIIKKIRVALMQR